MAGNPSSSVFDANGVYGVGANGVFRKISYPGVTFTISSTQDQQGGVTFNATPSVAVSQIIAI